MQKTCLALLTIVSTIPALPASADVPEFQGTIEVQVDGQQIEGTALEYNPTQLLLLGRDGWLWDLSPSKVAEARRVSEGFQGYSPSRLRAELLRELGRDFEVSGQSHYMVAHVAGQRDRWARRFEEFYRSFVRYFSVRGFELQQPPFPLIGIVLRDRAEFQRHVARRGYPEVSGMLGYYSPVSNRITLFDRGEDDESNVWHKTERIILHEATHQVAFNTGVHNRYAPPPKWVVEGLATMFEAAGVHDSRSYRRRSDRINRGQLESFRRSVEPNHRPELLQELVASDRLFRTKTAVAYAEAWALSFFLVETRPKQYMAYLAATADRPPFSEYSPSERTADFTAAFGDDWQLLEVHLLRFLATLKLQPS